MGKKIQRVSACLTLITFLATQPSFSVPDLFAGGISAAIEVKIPARFALDIPSELGRIETVVKGAGPTILHIQTAHGNYEAQKNIQAILRHLHDQYGTSLLLLEGSAFKLDP